MYIRRRICGLAIFSMGVGSFLVLMFSAGALFMAALFLIIGFWMLFL